jgi:hypothetical protein
MPLLLKSVPPARGLNWLRDAFRLFLRKPLAFTAMFASFLLAAVVLSLVPVLGLVLPFALSPLLTLGFMVASQSALLDGPVHPGQFISPLRADPGRRRALLQLCALYAVLALGVVALGGWVAEGAFERLQAVMADPKASLEAVSAAVGDPQLHRAALLTGLLATLLSVPFWHAPALVHWGSQGVGQSLFSSTLALWRCKGAFAVYGAAWALSFLAFVTLLSLVGGLLGLGGLMTSLAMPLAMAFSTVFYVSLIFAFNDSFGGASAAPAAPAAPG